MVGACHFFEVLEPAVAVKVIFAGVIAIVVWVLLVRIIYEIAIAQFEVVRHLRQIRDKLEKFE